MKSRIPHAIAALLAASAVPLVLAQAVPYVQPPALPVATNPDKPLPQPPAGLVAEPVASASRTEGPEADVAKAIVDALNADPSMKHSKITVQPEEGGPITLTGVTLTQVQAKRALDIATQHAGEGKVANAIRAADV